MPIVKHEPFFRRHPVFTGAELAAHLTSGGEVGARGQEALLAYYTKAGRVVRVRRGLYAVIITRHSSSMAEPTRSGVT